MPDAAIMIALTEMAKVLIQGGIKLLMQSGKTEAEIEAIYQEQKAYFDQHPPDTLPDV